MEKTLEDRFAGRNIRDCGRFANFAKISRSPRSKLIVKVLKTKLDIAFFSTFFILLFQYYDKALQHVKLRKSFFEI